MNNKTFKEYSFVLPHFTIVDFWIPLWIIICLRYIHSNNYFYFHKCYNIMRRKIHRNKQRQVWNKGGNWNLHNRSTLQSKTWNTEMDKGFVLVVISQALSVSALSLTHHENVILHSTFLIVVLVFACTNLYKHWQINHLRITKAFSYK